MDKTSFTVPLMFVTECEDFAYVFGGSGFFIRIEGEVFLVTARHLLKGIEVNNLCIPYSTSDDSLVPFSEMGTFPPEMYKTYGDVCDVTVVRVKQGFIFDSGRSFISPLELSSSKPEIVRGTSTGFFIKGYPYANRDLFVDSQSKIIRVSSLTCELKDVAYKPKEDAYSFQLPDSFMFPSSDGMSGSPVFRFNSSSGEDLELVGVVVRKTRFVSMKGVMRLISTLHN